MGRKHSHSFVLIPLSDATVSQTSKIAVVDQLDYCKIHIKTAPGCTGTIQVFARYGQNDLHSLYSPLIFSTNPMVLAADGDTFLRLELLDFTDFYIVYTPISGSGTIEARLTSKTVGA